MVADLGKNARSTCTLSTMLYPIGVSETVALPAARVLARGESRTQGADGRSTRSGRAFPFWGGIRQGGDV